MGQERVRGRVDGTAAYAFEEFICLATAGVRRVRLGRNGVEDFLPLGPLTAFEREGLAKMLPELKGNIEKGVKFANV
eukprot:1031361-Pyramimonas_sp.AAC.1